MAFGRVFRISRIRNPRLYDLPELSSRSVVHTTCSAGKLSRAKQTVHPSKILPHRTLSRDRDPQSSPTLFDDYVVDEPILAKVDTGLPQPFFYLDAFSSQGRSLGGYLSKLPALRSLRHTMIST